MWDITAHWYNSPTWIDHCWSPDQNLFQIIYSTMFIDDNSKAWTRYSRQYSQPLIFFNDKFTNQRFGRRRSRFDNAFKWNGIPIESKSDFRSLFLDLHIWWNIFTSSVRRWTLVWAWGYFPGRQLVVLCHIQREDRMQSSITSCR